MNTENIFASDEEAFEYLELELEKRYGEDFIFQGVINIAMYESKDEPKLYAGQYAPASDPSKTFSGNVTPWGSVSDTYGQYLFKEEVESRCLNTLERFPFVESVTAELDPEVTSKVWKEGDSLEAYMGSGARVLDPFVRVEVYLSDEYTSEEQAEQIKRCMDSIYDIGFGVYILFFTEAYDTSALHSCKFATGLEPEFRLGVDEYLNDIKNSKYSMDLDRGYITRDDIDKYR